MTTTRIYGGPLYLAPLSINQILNVTPQSTLGTARNRQQFPVLIHISVHPAKNDIAKIHSLGLSACMIPNCFLQ